MKATLNADAKRLPRSAWWRMNGYPAGYRTTVWKASPSVIHTLNAVKLTAALRVSANVFQGKGKSYIWNFSKNTSPTTEALPLKFPSSKMINLIVLTKTVRRRHINILKNHNSTWIYSRRKEAMTVWRRKVWFPATLSPDAPLLSVSDDASQHTFPSRSLV